MQLGPRTGVRFPMTDEEMLEISQMIRMAFQIYDTLIAFTKASPWRWSWLFPE